MEDHFNIRSRRGIHAKREVPRLQRRKNQPMLKTQLEPAWKHSNSLDRSWKRPPRQVAKLLNTKSKSDWVKGVGADYTRMESFGNVDAFVETLVSSYYLQYNNRKKNLTFKRLPIKRRNPSTHITHQAKTSTV